MGSKDNLALLEEAKELVTQARATIALTESDHKKQIDKLSSEVNKLREQIKAKSSDVEKEAGADDAFSLGEVTGPSSSDGRHPVYDLLDKIVD